MAEKTIDITHLRLNHHRENRPHPRQRPQQFDLRRGMEMGGDLLFDADDCLLQPVQLRQHRPQGLRRVGRKLFAESAQGDSAGFAEEIAQRRRRQAVLGQRRVDPVLELGALPHQRHPRARQLPGIPHLGRGNPHRRKRPGPLQQIEAPGV